MHKTQPDLPDTQPIDNPGSRCYHMRLECSPTSCPAPASSSTSHRSPFQLSKTDDRVVTHHPAGERVARERLSLGPAAADMRTGQRVQPGLRSVKRMTRRRRGDASPRPGFSASCGCRPWGTTARRSTPSRLVQLMNLEQPLDPLLSALRIDSGRVTLRVALMASPRPAWCVLPGARAALQRDVWDASILLDPRSPSGDPVTASRQRPSELR